MKQPVPAFGGKERWMACDDALFFLTIEGIISESEAVKARRRLLKKCLDDGVALHEHGHYYGTKNPKTTHE